MKSPTHIVMTSAANLLGLSRRIARAPQPTGSARQAQPFGQGVRKGRALVIAAPPLTPPVQRDWYDDIGSGLAKSRRGQFGPKLTERFRQVFAAQVLHAQDDIAEQAVVGAESDGVLEMKRRHPAVGAAVFERGQGEWPDCGGAARTGRERIGR